MVTWHLELTGSVVLFHILVGNETVTLRWQVGTRTERVRTTSWVWPAPEANNNKGSDDLNKSQQTESTNDNAKPEQAFLVEKLPDDCDTTRERLVIVLLARSKTSTADWWVVEANLSLWSVSIQWTAIALVLDSIKSQFEWCTSFIRPCVVIVFHRGIQRGC